MQNFLLPLTPPIPISEGSCSKNLTTISGPLVFFLANWLTWSLTSPPLTGNCWQLSPQFGIFAISVMDDLSNFGLITNHLWPLCLVFRFPFHPVNSAIWLSFLNSLCRCCICQVWKTLLPIFCLAVQAYQHCYDRSQSRTAGTGQPGKDSWDRTSRKGEPDQESPRMGKENRTGRRWHAEQDCQDRTARTGPPGQCCRTELQCMMVGRGLPRQNSQSSFCYNIALILVLSAVLPNLKGSSMGLFGLTFLHQTLPKQR